MTRNVTKSMLLAALVLGLAAAPAMADRRDGGRPCDGPGYGAQGKMRGAVQLTDEQKAAAEAVQAKYQDQINNLRSKMAEQRSAMHKAVANDATTIGQIDALRTSMFDLHQAMQKVQFNLRQDLRRAGVPGAGFGTMRDGHGRFHGHRGSGYGDCPLTQQDNDSPAVDS